MKHRITHLITLLFVLFISQGCAKQVVSQTESASGKVYTVYTSPDFDYGCTVTNISQETFQDTSCIKGTDTSSWAEGRTIRMPVQHIHMIIEFDSLEDFRNSIKKHQEK